MTTSIKEDIRCPYYVADVFTTELLRCVLYKNHEFMAGREAHQIDQKYFMKG